MSEDEAIVVVFTTMIGTVNWVWWWWRAVRVSPMACSSAMRTWMLLLPLLLAALTLFVLKTMAAEDVRNAPQYLYFYMALGAAWVGISRITLPMFCISPQDDVLERCNPAACVAVTGALVGLTLCYAGANIGNGPGWWVVAFTAGLATASFAILWFLMDRLGRFSEWITVDRDLASGIRLAAALVAIGAVLARAAAGDWHSAEATLADFARIAWFAVLVAIAAVLAENVLHPTAENPLPSPITGVVPGVIYLAGAASSLIVWGWP